MRLPTLKWTGDALELLDQTLLPNEVVIRRCVAVADVYDAIKRLVVRGAPALGVAAGYGILLSLRAESEMRPAEMRQVVEDAAAHLASCRPTAVNVAWAVGRMVAAARAAPDAELEARLTAEARAIEAEDREANRRLGAHGAALLRDGDAVLTHCNAGALATADYGTALGVIYAAGEQGKRITVYADETRPLLQGARLTAWELLQSGVPVTVLCDDMAASVMAAGKVACVLVGADRIAANGDAANKVGTMAVAVLARYFRVPFYVAAPTSTLDTNVASGRDIPIEERDAEEVAAWGGVRTVPVGAAVYNPAFDVTPANLIDAFITEEGIARPPFETSLAALRRGRGGG
jgi:methylthioribose-1-phosphate isomerase